ncbi:hypothetical protein ACSVJ5_004370, partial [Vibrio vulnificus]
GGVSYFNFESFGFVKIVLRFLLWLDFSVSETGSLVESQLCDTVFSNERFGVVNPFSTAL